MVVERRDAVVVEPGRGGSEDRHALPGLAEGVAVAHHLARHVAKGILSAATLELIDRDHVGEVEHVDLLELGGCAELGCHDIKRGINERDDPGVALADTGGLDDDKVVSRCLARGDRVGEVLGNLGGASCGHGSEEHLAGDDRVHADAVAEKCSTTTSTSGIDGDHGHAYLALLIQPKAAQKLVREARLARAAGACDAQHRCCAAGSRGEDVGPEGLGGATGFEHSDRAGE